MTTASSVGSLTLSPGSESTRPAYGTFHSWVDVSARSEPATMVRQSGEVLMHSPGTGQMTTGFAL